MCVPRAGETVEASPTSPGASVPKRETKSLSPLPVFSKGNNMSFLDPPQYSTFSSDLHNDLATQHPPLQPCCLPEQTLLSAAFVLLHHPPPHMDSDSWCPSSLIPSLPLSIPEFSKSRFKIHLLPETFPDSDHLSTFSSRLIFF